MGPPVATGGRTPRQAGRPGGLRPTSGRVRTAVGNALAPRLAGAEVLDLFAGTGGLGMEALRRGARHVVFVERDPRRVRALRGELEREGLRERAEVRRGNVFAEVPALGAEGRRFDVILLDPPYGQGLLARCLGLLAATRLLAPGGVIVAEGHWRDDPGEIPGLRLVRTARYGETALWFYGEEGA